MKDAEIYKKINQIVQTWIPLKTKYTQTPGWAITVSHKGKVMLDYSYGFADVQKKELVKKDTLFRVASISKMFTAVSVLQLVDQGKLSLETKVSAILPPFFKIKELRDITIRNILSHQSGVFRDSNKDYWESREFPDNTLADVSSGTRVVQPLKHFKYSNFGYSILGKVIEQVSGLSYGDYVTKNIISKLKLKNTYPDYTRDLDQALAFGYSKFIPEQKRITFPHSATHEFAPATGFVSTTNDLVVFLDDLTSKKPTILPIYLRDEMLHPYSKTGDGDEVYGLGCSIEYVEKKKVIGHGGGYPGFITMAQSVPEEELSIAVFTNCLGGPSVNVTSDILKLFLWLKDFKKEKKKLSAEKYEGTYSDSWGESFIVGVEDKLISLSPDSNLVFNSLTPLEQRKNGQFTIKSKFLYGSPEEVVSFEDFKNGKAQTIVWAGGRSKRVSKK
jgi:CubicO group peptidase (beta-lactamase class C family)